MKKFIFVMLFVILSAETLAAPVMPLWGINKQTKECAEFFMGDECMSCGFPEGWEYCDTCHMPKNYIEKGDKPCPKGYSWWSGGICVPDGAESIGCPEGFKEGNISSIDWFTTCKPIKSEMCCTFGHTGASGDCEDVIVNEQEQKCAFVEDINECDNLPEGWKRAEEDPYEGRICPDWEWEWLNEDIKCEISKNAKGSNNFFVLFISKIKEWVFRIVQ